MAQRRDPIKSGVQETGTWVPIVLLLSVLIVILPSIPVSLTVAAGSGLILLMAFLA